MVCIKNITVLISIILTPVLLASCVSGTQKGPPDTPVHSTPGMAAVPAGWFLMGSNKGEINEAPAHKVYLDEFYIDKHEVSAGEFAEFLNEAKNGSERYLSVDEYSTITAVPGSEGGALKFTPREGYGRYPANNVSWYGASEFCRSRGKRLPTEAEWEKAARGTSGGKYPWGGSAPSQTKARYGQSWDEKGLDVMVHVDSLEEGASSYGAINMAGNVLEWVQDWYRQNYYDYQDPSYGEHTPIAIKLIHAEEPVDIAEDGLPPLTNPKGPAIGSFRVLRGGSWHEKLGPYKIRATHRFWLAPIDRYLNTGFRCAKDVEIVTEASEIVSESPAPDATVPDAQAMEAEVIESFLEETAPQEPPAMEAETAMAVMVREDAIVESPRDTAVMEPRPEETKVQEPAVLDENLSVVPPSQDTPAFEPQPEVGPVETVGIAVVKEPERHEIDEVLPPIDFVLFDFGSSKIRVEATKILEGLALWLNSNPSASAVIIGRCDNRGTNAYNIVLGKKRAEAVMDYLLKMEVSPLKVTAISYGKEFPVCTEKTRDCRARNRRVDFILILKLDDG